jgi:hypothetical protein
METERDRVTLIKDLLAVHWSYLKYLARHKGYVFWACLGMEVPLHRAIMHDWTKFLPSEWVPYAKYFYGNYRTPLIEESFDIAWNYHQKRNDHHWQYYVLLRDDGTTEALPMPNRALREMVADWIGAGLAITGKIEVNQWYQRNKGKINLHDETRTIVEQLLNAI